MILTILLETMPVAGNSLSLIMIGLIFVIMYFFMIRPQQKQRKKIEEQRKALKVGDKIITSGGIYGRLKGINETTYEMEIAEGVKVTINKSSVFPVSGEFIDSSKK